MGSNRHVPQGAATQKPEELGPGVLGTVGMGIGEIRAEQVGQRTGIGMHHRREPLILGSKDLSDGRAIDLCCRQKRPEHPRGNEEW